MITPGHDDAHGDTSHTAHDESSVAGHPGGVTNPTPLGRPRNMSAAELGFRPRPRVPWLAPRLLAATAVRAGLAENFGAYLDKRELQGALPAQIHHHDTPGDLWLDYVADLGDGFDATYSVAWLLAQRELSLTDSEGGEHTLPRGHVLVMGGDQVYPTADWRQYENRCKGPYRAALPEPGDDREPPSLYALPGNHDWYDGLTAFLRLFGKGEPIGGWQTRQARSYFALALPRRWWLLAIDAQFDAYLDEPQLEYFLDVARRLRQGDRVIICAARPTWVHGAEAPHEYDTLDYFIRRIVTPTGAAVALMLAGDSHHYARYEQENAPASQPSDTPETREAPETRDGSRSVGDAGSTSGGEAARQLITCGGGGAYLAATHTLPGSIVTPPEGSLVRHVSPRRRYQLRARYPVAAESRRFSWGVFFRLPWRNPGFNTLLAGLHTLLLAAYVSGTSEGAPWFTVPILGMSAVMLLSSLGFASVDRKGRLRPRHLVLGTLHGLAHLGLGLAGAWLWGWVGVDTLPAAVRLLLALAIYAPLAGGAASLLVCGYLLTAHRFHVNVNELYAGQGIEDAKSFLRLRFGHDGSLTVYPVAVDRVCRRWHAAPDEPADTSWITPEQRLPARLSEPPVHVGR